MANRNFNRVQSATKEAKLIHAHVAIGSSGAPTLNASKSQGVASISRTSEGLYVLTLSDLYNSLLGFQAMVIGTSADNIKFQVNAEAVATAKTITFNTYAPTAADDTALVVNDPVDGSIIKIAVWVKNTDVL